ncbi:MAG: hypothetical protein ACP5SJ_00360 [Candidatus Micrarchaeia archaeon]
MGNIEFSKVKGFNRAFALGGILGIIIFIGGEALGIAYLAVLIALFVLLAYAYNTIRSENKKRYNLFVFSFTALFGFVFGGIFLYLMEKHPRFFNWSVPFSIAAIAALIIIGIVLGQNTTLFRTGLAETIPSGNYYYLQFKGYGNSILAGSYSSTGPINAYILNESSFNYTQVYGFGGASSIWQLTNSTSGSFSVSIAPGSYVIVFYNEGEAPVTLQITKNVTLSS